MSLKNFSQEFVKPKRVVLIGGTGFIGKELTKQLGDQKIDFLSLSSKDLNLLEANSPSHFSMLKADDSVVFLSALTPDKGKDAATTLKNLKMAENLANFVEKNPVKHFVLIGSDAIYEDDIRAVPVNEMTPTAPTSLYGLSHLGRELILKTALAQSKTPWVFIRPSAVYGLGDTHNSYGPNRFFRTATESQKITLFGEGEEKRDHIWVKDLCSLIILSLGHVTQGVLNGTTGVSHSFMDVAKEVQKVRGENVKIECLSKGGPVTHRHYDVSARLKLFPTFHTTPLREALSQLK
jgi:UDP-glucose 4-epimerase